MQNSNYDVIIVNFYTGSGYSYSSHFLPYNVAGLGAEEPRIIEDVSFVRSFGTEFWGQKPRGTSGFGVIRFANSDGALDFLLSTNFRDSLIGIVRGNSTDSGSFATVAFLIVDRVAIESESVIAVYTKDNTARLEVAAQTAIYATTVPNRAIHGRPMPWGFGKAYQVPPVERNTSGNRSFDIMDSEYFIGIDQLMDRGTCLLPEDKSYQQGTTYNLYNQYRPRSTLADCYGFDRLSAIKGKQVASAQLQCIPVEVFNKTFDDLSGWTETNGGVAGRDASITSNFLRFRNTLGGAELSLQENTTNTSTEDDHWLVIVNVTSMTAGEFFVAHGSSGRIAKINKAGVHRFVFKSASNFNLSIRAWNGGGCDCYIESMQLYKLTLVQYPYQIIPHIASSDVDYDGRGPLDGVGAGIDSDSMTNMPDYRLGFYTTEPILISDLMDKVMASVGGWWTVNYLGILIAAQLTDPTSETATYAFDDYNITSDVEIEFDPAPGLSNRILALKNFYPYTEGEVAEGAAFVQMNPYDKDQDIVLSEVEASDGFNYLENIAITSLNPGSARSVPFYFGEKVYFEVECTSINTASDQWRIGVAGVRANVAGAPGASDHSIGYGQTGIVAANGLTYLSGKPSYGNGSVVMIAADMRAPARAQGYLNSNTLPGQSIGGYLYYGKDGTWNDSSTPSSSHTAVAANFKWLTPANCGYTMIGGNSVAAVGNVTVNFGHREFRYAIPDDYFAPAHHFQNITARYRYEYESTVALDAAYATAEGYGSKASPEGAETLISHMEEARTECDRRCTLYSTKRNFYKWKALVNDSIQDVQQGDCVTLTSVRFGFTNKKLKVCAVKGNLLDSEIEIQAWG
jgi:hypothetical protein